MRSEGWGPNPTGLVSLKAEDENQGSMHTVNRAYEIRKVAEQMVPGETKPGFIHPASRAARKHFYCLSHPTISVSLWK